MFTLSEDDQKELESLTPTGESYRFIAEQFGVATMPDSILGKSGRFFSEGSDITQRLVTILLSGGAGYFASKLSEDKEAGAVQGVVVAAGTYGLLNLLHLLVRSFWFMQSTTNDIERLYTFLGRWPEYKIQVPLELHPIFDRLYNDFESYAGKNKTITRNNFVKIISMLRAFIALRYRLEHQKAGRRS